MENWKLSWSKLLLFTQANIDTLVEGIQGVYRISKREGDKTFVFYIGRGDIKTRLAHHISGQEENECIKSTVGSYACYFRYSIITNEEVSKAAERRLYKVYLPSCNAVEPAGSDDIMINLD